MSVHNSETKTCIFCRKNIHERRINPNSKLFQRRKYYFEYREKIFKEKGGCEICKIMDIEVLEFDHFGLTLFQVSKWYTSFKYDEKDLEKEVDKTRILCRFHHNIHYKLQMQSKKVESETWRNKFINKKRQKIIEIKLENVKCVPEK